MKAIFDGLRINKEKEKTVKTAMLLESVEIPKAMRAKEVIDMVS